MILGGRLLEYPPGWAGTLILLIESVAALSLGITLVVLFIGGRPSTTGRTVTVNSTGERKQDFPQKSKNNVCD
jgi:hypothetical protein